MGIFTFIDMEGATGIDDTQPMWYQCNSEEWEKYGRDTVTADVKAVVKACKEAGIQEVSLCDVHGLGNSIRWEEILCDDLKFTIVPNVFNLEIPENSDYGILIGFHAMNQEEGIVPHSLRSDIEWITVNGKVVGEIEIYTKILSEKGIPTIMVTGDYHAVVEASKIIPHVVGVAVKSKAGKDITHLSRKDADELLHRKAKEALKKADQIPVLDVTFPLEISLSLVNLDYVAGLVAADISEVKIEGKELKWTSQTYLEFFKKFLDIIPHLNKEMNQSVLTNRRFFYNLRQKYPDLLERKDEISQALQERELTKRSIFLDQEEREMYLKIVSDCLDLG